MQPKQLSRELRQGRSRHLSRRRGILALSLAAAGSMGVIALYQMGLIKHLPEPPLKGFDADKVDASEEAYSYFSTPDAVLGLASYAATATLASMGGKDRAMERPWIPLAMAGKVAADAAMAAKLTWDQWAKHKAFCFWCLLAAGATFAAATLVIPEARAALKQVSRNRQPAREFTRSSRYSRPVLR